MATCRGPGPWKRIRIQGVGFGDKLLGMDLEFCGDGQEIIITNYSGSIVGYAGATSV